MPFECLKATGLPTRAAGLHTLLDSRGLVWGLTQPALHLLWQHMQHIEVNFVTHLNSYHADFPRSSIEKLSVGCDVAIGCIC